MNKRSNRGIIAIVASMLGTMVRSSCSHEDYVYNEEKVEQSATEKYAAAFEKAFGKVAPTVDWGFGSGNTRALTRSITVNGDRYDKFPSTDEINSYFPTAIPEGADEVSQLETLYKNTTVKDQWGTDQTLWGIYQIYQYKIVEGYNLKITSAGTYDVGGCQNIEWVNGKSVYKYYNVYVDVPNNGEVIINRPQDSHFNLYIIHGNVKMGPNQASEWSSQAISVGSGATFTDSRDHIAANGGVKLYNRGIVNATNTSKYDIGNFCTVYNEGKFNVSGPLTYSPADANASFFMNHGDDAELVAPAMTLNSSGNFFNDGKVTINGATTVTNDGIFWVNAGHYTTGSMTFSAHNETFYNYCNLIVKGHANMYCGTFHLMDNSYTEVGSANLGQENFRINMGNNAGFNAKGNVRFEKNADNTEQGFFASGTKAYVRIDGKAQVEKHKYIFVLDGNITYAIKEGVENLEAIDPYYSPYSEFRSGTTEVKAEDFSKFTVTLNTNSCGATWNIDGEDPVLSSYRVIAEDLSASQGSDFDFNDVVFDVDPYDNGTGATITILAAGGIWPLKINGEEVHLKLIPTIETFKYKHNGVEYDCYPMINTGETGEHGASTTNKPTIEVTTGDWSSDENIRNSIKEYIVLKVYKYGDTEGEVLTANSGTPTCKILVDKSYKINSERNNISNGTKFKEYVAGNLGRSVWW